MTPWHPFLGTLIKNEGFRVIEVPVSTNPRFSGTSRISELRLTNRRVVAASDDRGTYLLSHPPAEFDALGYSLPLVKQRATD